MKRPGELVGGDVERTAEPQPDGQQQDGRRPEIERLRLALAQMSGAERRLRGRDHNRPGELTFAQLRSLAALARAREMTAGQLARSAELNPATVTAMLDQLEAANIVRRHRSTEDRRVCNVSLTPAGWELLERKLANWQAMWEQKLVGVSDRDLAIAARVVRQVTELYESIGESPDDPEPHGAA
ncbi:MAG: MarR family winged helix-turn-helix transcriptional regulator [Solirubrobacteraceae bacterium]